MLQLPEAFAPASAAHDETGLFHVTQMFGDSLPGDAQTGSEIRDGKGSVGGQAADQPQAVLITQGGKEACFQAIWPGGTEKTSTAQAGLSIRRKAGSFTGANAKAERSPPWLGMTVVAHNSPESLSYRRFANLA